MKTYSLVFNKAEWFAGIRNEILQSFHILNENSTTFNKRTDGLKQAQDIVWVKVVAYTDQDALALVLKYGDHEVGSMS